LLKNVFQQPSIPADGGFFMQHISKILDYKKYPFQAQATLPCVFCKKQIDIGEKFYILPGRKAIHIYHDKK